MGQYRGEFTLRLGGGDQPAVDADIAAGAGKGVDLGGIHQEEVVTAPRGFTGCNQAITQGLDITLHQGVGVDLHAATDTAHKGLAEPLLLHRGQEVS